MWKEECRSWYKDNETGRVNGKYANGCLCYMSDRFLAIWPGASLMYQQVISSPRYEDFEITYNYKNPWAHLGMGWTVETRNPAAHDVSPYLRVDAIDPLWEEAVGGDPKLVGPGKEMESPARF